MKLSFCVLLSLFFATFHVHSSAVGVENLGKLRGDENKASHVELNSDCIILILEKVKFVDLLNAVQVNEEFSALAVSVFRRKFSNLQIVIRFDFLLSDDPKELFSVAGMQVDSDTIKRVNGELLNVSADSCKETKTHIELENCDLILKTFKYFGHLIKKFQSVTCIWTPAMQAELVARLISKYSSESLLDFQMLNKGDILLKHMTKPLVNVEDVTFYDQNLGFKPHTTHPIQLFPSVRRLNLNSLFDYEAVYFNHHMPNLTHVALDRTGRGGSAFPDVIMKNPQIQSIDLYNAPSEFIRTVSIVLPQLETLKLSRFELSVGSIRFENVTKFLMGYFTTPANLHLPKLRSIHIDYNSRHYDDYLQFFNEHNHVNHLYLRSFEMEEDDTKLKQFTADLIDLEEVTLERVDVFRTGDNLSSDIVVEFLRSHHKITQLNVIYFPSDCKALLQEQLKEEWDSSVDGDNLSFRRKMNISA